MSSRFDFDSQPRTGVYVPSHGPGSALITRFLTSKELQSNASVSSGFRDAERESHRDERPCSRHNEDDGRYYYFSLPKGKECPWYAKEHVFPNQRCAAIEIGPRTEWPRYLRKTFGELKDTSINTIYVFFSTVSAFGIICRILFESDHYRESKVRSFEKYFLNFLVTYPNNHARELVLKLVQQQNLTAIEISDSLLPIWDQIDHGILFQLLKHKVKPYAVRHYILPILNQIDHDILFQLLKHEVDPYAIRHNILPILDNIDHNKFLRLLGLIDHDDQLFQMLEDGISPEVIEQILLKTSFQSNTDH